MLKIKLTATINEDGVNYGYALPLIATTKHHGKKWMHIRSNVLVNDAYDKCNEYEQAVILQKAFILTIGAIKTKLSLTNGKDYEMWNEALRQAREYRYFIMNNGKYNEQMRDGAKAFLESIDFESGTIEECNEANSFLRLYSIPTCETMHDLKNVLLDLASGETERAVKRFRMQKGADGKKHKVESIEKEETAYAKAQKNVELACLDDVGKSLVHDSVASLTELLFFGLIRKPSDFDFYSNFIFKRLHHVIYSEKRSALENGHDTKDNDNKLGTKETRTTSDTTSEWATAQEFVDSVKRNVMNDTTIRKKATRQAYVVLIQCAVNGCFNDTDFIASVLDVSERQVNHYRASFQEYMIHTPFMSDAIADRIAFYMAE